MSASLEIRDLTVHFDALCAVSELSLDLPAGSVTALIGPNGAGKSTAFNAITGFVRPSSGMVRLDGVELTEMAAHEIAARGVVRTFQRKSIFPRLTIRENLRVALHRAEPRSLVSSTLSLPRFRRAQRDLAARAGRLADEVGLPALDREAGALPYGQQRFLALAIALAARPRFLLLDEPTAGMNTTETRRMTALLSAIAGEGVGVLLVEHDMRFVMGVARRVSVLNAGAKIAEGTPREIQDSGEVRAAYLGERRTPC